MEERGWKWSTQTGKKKKTNALEAEEEYRAGEGACRNKSFPMFSLIMGCVTELTNGKW